MSTEKVQGNIQPPQDGLTLSASTASSPLESSSNAATTTVHDESEPEIEADRAAGTKHVEEGNNPSQNREAENDSGSESEASGDSEDDGEAEEEEEINHVHLPRQGLPSFWHALKRLNIREPRSIVHSLNFFRWHVIIGIFVPLITAGIFCACNTRVPFVYIDALFMCTSALTLTGLSSILLADMSFGQQFILYLLLQFGSIQFVSFLVLFVRRSTFSKKFDPNRSYWPHKSIILKDEEFNLANDILDDPDEVPQLDENGLKKRRRRRRRSSSRVPAALKVRRERTKITSNDGITGNGNIRNQDKPGEGKRNTFKLKRMNSPLSMQSDDYASHPLKKRPTQASEVIRPTPSNDNVASNEGGGGGVSTSASHPLDKHRHRMRQRTLMPSNTATTTLRRTATRTGGGGTRTGTNISNGTGRKSTISPHAHPHHHHHQSSRGGFPNPIQAIFSEGVYQLKKRTNTRNRSSTHFREYYDVFESGLHGHNGDRNDGGFPRSDTMLSRRWGLGRVGTRLAASTEEENPDLENGRQIAEREGNGDTMPKRQLSVSYRFGRNSTVRDLSKDAHQKLAQLEISGMTLLMYIIAIYWIGLQLLFVIVWSPYFEAGHFDSVFQQYNPDVSRTWFSVFQSASMLNNSGLSLVDGSLVPFRTCYIMLVPGVFLMLLGNLGYPISLRFTIWLLHACLSVTSKLRFITSFMLAHPRRIFYYIFPPYETRALFLVVMLLTTIDWVCFFLLDIGFTSPVFSISTGTAVLSGLVQSVAVRSAGFYTVPLYQVAPALDMLYLFMMAFCVYPLALAIRATNVYEERSLGIQHENEASLKSGIVHLRREKGYSKFHLREQLAYDVWYILLAYWLICIVERNNIGINGAEPEGSIDMFAILFEVTSAYANVGFSIGSAAVDTSISGGLRHLSKLILCATMIRGRTRGLPVLIDRAVLTPRQLERYGDPADGGATDDDEGMHGVEPEARSRHVA